MPLYSQIEGTFGNQGTFEDALTAEDALVMAVGEAGHLGRQDSFAMIHRRRNGPDGATEENENEATWSVST